MEVKTVLIVEDSQTQARLIEKRLQDLGLKVEKAGEGKQALEFLEGATVDLIISDINMQVLGLKL